jgi:hypothetical protein
VTRRIVLLVASLWAVLYVLQRLAEALFNFMRLSMTDYAWAIQLSIAVPIAVAAWLIGRWRGLAGRRLALASGVTLLVSVAAWYATAMAVMSLPPARAFSSVGAVAIEAVVYLVLAAEVVAVSWLVAGLSMGPGVAPSQR